MTALGWLAAVALVAAPVALSARQWRALRREFLSRSTHPTS